jgi:(R,R)-butanediol dehydrogenase / meso-butanediol dehydrogenase / diacetyl reductase
MRAATFHTRRDIRIEDVPPPGALQAGQVRVRPIYCGICGTDLHEYTDGPIVIPVAPHPLTGATAPQILGHEFAATVLEVDGGVDSAAAGDLVSIMPLISCGQCGPCRRADNHLCRQMACTGLSWQGGGLSDEVLVPGYQVFKLPDGVSALQGAIVEPAAVAAHGVDRTGLRPGNSVLIVGGGPIGVLAALYARAAGAGRIIISEPNQYRRAFVERLDIGYVVDPGTAGFHDALDDLTDGLGADVAVECSATEAGLSAALAGVRTRGKISQVALHVRPALIDPMLLCNMSLTVEGIWCYPTNDWPRIMSLISTGRFPVEQVVSHEIPLESAVRDGFDELCSPASTAVKVLIQI